MGGKCTGWTAVERVFELGNRCAGCKYLDTEKGKERVTCGLLTAADLAQSWAEPTKCPGLDLITKGVI